MQVFKTDYEPFYNALYSFVTQLPSHLSPSAPPELSSKVGVLARILPLNDPSFSKGDVKTLGKKFFIVHDVLNKLLELGPNEVTEDSLSWFSTESSTLLLQMFSVKLALAGLQLGESSDVSVISAGIGGVNPGVQHSIGSANIRDLGKLISALKSLINSGS